MLYYQCLIIFVISIFHLQDSQIQDPSSWITRTLCVIHECVSWVCTSLCMWIECLRKPSKFNLKILWKPKFSGYFEIFRRIRMCFFKFFVCTRHVIASIEYNQLLFSKTLKIYFKSIKSFIQHLNNNHSSILESLEPLKKVH